MANITYLLGAGASFNACPILNQQAEAMSEMAHTELTKFGHFLSSISTPSYKETELDLLKTNREKVLWHIGYFGLKAKEFGTIDIYARKLHLQGKIAELNLLKMSISVFFDLWENFYEERYSHICQKQKLNMEKESYFVNGFEKIDKRYVSLFSVFLNKTADSIILDNNIKFITWNYDLQLENTFKLFSESSTIQDLESINNHFPFIRNSDSENQVYHLNGHRGFYDYNAIFSNGRKKDMLIEARKVESFNEYWKLHSDMYDKTMDGSMSFKNFINYAWEHDFEQRWFEKIKNVLKETEVLIIIGYSFPPFNRLVDQFMMSNLIRPKLKEIVYQDPNANKEIIENLFADPKHFKYKTSASIRIIKENLEQFHIPNNYFNKQIARARSIVV